MNESVTASGRGGSLGPLYWSVADTGRARFYTLGVALEIWKSGLTASFQFYMLNADQSREHT